MFQVEDDSFREARDRLLIERTKIENEEYVKELIVNLERLQKEWQEILQDLKKQKDKYNELIDEAKKIKQIIINNGLKSNISKINKFKIRILNKK